MTPVCISGCFGWLHMPDAVPVSGRGVVLCSTFGNEAMNVHRAWVMLAERLADAGLPTVRFDYPGTGDSIAAEEAITLDAVTRGIVEAASWLKTRTGVAEVALCGLRAGATLATLAAPLIAGGGPLALLSPVVSGRTYLRELMITARAWDAIWMVEQPIEYEGWFEAAGLRCKVAFKQELGAVDLRALAAPPTSRVLIVDAGTAGAVQTFADRLRSLGAMVEQRPFPGSEALMRDALESEVSHAAFASISKWLAQDAPPYASATGAAADAAVELHHVIPTDADFDCCRGERNHIVTPLPDAGIHAFYRDIKDVDGRDEPRIKSGDGHDGFGMTEQPVRFGHEDHLFGIYATPGHTPTADYALLILNTGGHGHVGHSRYAVTLARRLARTGVPSLRMDASGIGDSDPRTGENGRFYDASAISDTRAGLDWLARRTGRRVVILGVCSGAYNALQLGIADPRVAGLALVNQQRFVWSPGLSLRVIQRSTRRTTEFYLRNIRTGKVWRRLLRADIDVLGIGRALAGRAARRIRSAADPFAARLGVRSRFSLVRSWFRILDRRGVPVLIALSFNDPGIDELEEYFGAHGRRLNAFPLVRVARLDNTDHTLSHHESREAFFAVVSEWLDASFPARAREQPRVPAMAAE